MELRPPNNPTPFAVKRPLVLAFYQMDWFTSTKGERLRTLNQFYRDPDSWRTMLTHTATGKILQVSFKDLYDTIVWRMANPGECRIVPDILSMMLSKNPYTSIPDFDQGYIRHLIGNLKPEVVIGLGAAAKEGVSRVVCQIPVRSMCLFGKHPMEEGAHESLSSLAEEVNRELQNYGR